MSKRASNFPGEKRVIEQRGRENQKRRVLIFGAGVIGSYLAHVLCEAGNEVTVLAREARADSLNKNGLVIRHHLQGKVTKDRVEAVTSVEGFLTRRLSSCRTIS